MDYLQYLQTQSVVDGLNSVLNLIINGLPSILSSAALSIASSSEF